MTTFSDFNEIPIVGFDVGLTCMGISSVMCDTNTLISVHDMTYIKFNHDRTSRILVDYANRLKQNKDIYGGVLTYLNESIYHRVQQQLPKIFTFIDSFIEYIPRDEPLYFALEQPFMAGSKLVKAFQKQVLLNGYLTILLKTRYPQATIIGVENRIAKLSTIGKAIKDKEKIVKLMIDLFPTLGKITKNFSKEGRQSSIEGVMIAIGALGGITFLSNIPRS
jgi:hypothetical protein